MSQLRRAFIDLPLVKVAKASHVATADMDALTDQRYIDDGINPLAGLEYYTFAEDGDDRTRFIKDQPDLLHMKFILAHANVPNANGDAISDALMSKIWRTALYKPIDVEHEKPTIGTIVSSIYRHEKEPYYTECQAVIWSMFYPEVARQVRTQYHSRGVRMSMELLFKSCEYHWGDKVLSEGQAARAGIIDKRGQKVDGKLVSRWFHEEDACFGGAAVVKDPADPGAYILAAASEDRAQWQRVHAQLHRLWEAQDFSVLSKASIVGLHQWIHDNLGDI